MPPVCHLGKLRGRKVGWIHRSSFPSVRRTIPDTPRLNKPDANLSDYQSEAISEMGQTRTSSLGAARPLPPSADIGQSVGSNSPNARRCTRSRLICRRRSSRISNRRTGWRARRERGLMRRSSARCRTIARSTRTPGGTTGFGRLIHYRDVFDKRSWTRLSPASPPTG